MPDGPETMQTAHPHVPIWLQQHIKTMLLHNTWFLYSMNKQPTLTFPFHFNSTLKQCCCTTHDSCIVWTNSGHYVITLSGTSSRPTCKMLWWLTCWRINSPEILTVEEQIHWKLVKYECHERTAGPQRKWHVKNGKHRRVSLKLILTGEWSLMPGLSWDGPDRLKGY